MRFFSVFTKAILFFLFSFIVFLFIPHPHNETEIFISPNLLGPERLSSFSKVVYSFPGLLVNPSKIRFGVYKIKKNCNYLSVFRTIHYNRQVSLPFRIREGMSMAQIRQKMLESENFRGAFPEDVPEGMIMPDTYCFAYGTSRALAVRHMLEKSELKRSRIWKENDLFADKNEWITFASLLEKEGLCYEDKQRIAGVILNRIKKKIRLEIDATAIYAKTEGRYDKGLSWDEICSRTFALDEGVTISYKSPYNTYANKGLPPGPICSPGQESLIAALDPERHNYYYYRLIDGKHVFSKEFEAHKTLMQGRSVKNGAKSNGSPAKKEDAAVGRNKLGENEIKNSAVLKKEDIVEVKLFVGENSRQNSFVVKNLGKNAAKSASIAKNPTKTSVKGEVAAQKAKDAGGPKARRLNNKSRKGDGNANCFAKALWDT